MVTISKIEMHRNLDIWKTFWPIFDEICYADAYVLPKNYYPLSLTLWVDGCFKNISLDVGLQVQIFFHFFVTFCQMKAYRMQITKNTVEIVGIGCGIIKQWRFF